MAITVQFTLTDAEEQRFAFLYHEAMLVAQVDLKPSDLAKEILLSVIEDDLMAHQADGAVN